MGVGREAYKCEDEVLISTGEHFANISRHDGYIHVYLGQEYTCRTTSVRIPVDEFAKALGLATEDEILKLMQHIASLERKLDDSPFVWH